MTHNNALLVSSYTYVQNTRTYVQDVKSFWLKSNNINRVVKSVTVMSQKSREKAPYAMDIPPENCFEPKSGMINSP